MSMYSANNDTTVEIGSLKIEILNEQTVKRMRLEDGYDKEDGDYLKSPVSRKKNPFLKSPEISDKPTTVHSGIVNSPTNPLCVIEKNKIYDDNKIIVKSQ